MKIPVRPEIFLLILTSCLPLPCGGQTPGPSRDRAEALGKQAAAAVEMKNYEVAAESCTEAAALYRELGETASEAECLLLAGIAEQEQKKIEPAIEKISRSAYLFDRLGKRAQAAEARLSLGRIYIQAERNQDAARELALAASGYRAAGHAQKELISLGELGITEGVLGLFREAAAHLEQALEIDRRLGGTVDSLPLRQNLGVIYKNQGRFGESRSLLEENLRASELVADRKAQADALSGLGVVHAATGDYEKARDFYRRAEELYLELGDSRGVQRVRGSIATLMVRQGLAGDPLAIFEETIRASRQNGDQDQLARSLSSAAVLLRHQGNVDGAVRYLQEALEIRRRLGDRAGEAMTLNNLAALETSRGRPEEALARLEESLALRRLSGDRPGLVTSLLNSGLAYADLVRFEEAVLRLEEGARVARELGLRDLEVGALFYLTQMESLLDRPEAALRHAEQALRIARESASPVQEAWALTAQAFVLIDLKRYREGRESLSKALLLARDQQDPHKATELLFLIGLTDWRQGRLREALTSLQEVVKKPGSARYHSQALATLSVIYADQGNLGEAIEAARRAVAAADATFAEIRTADLLAGFDLSVGSAYEQLISLLVRKGDNEEAFAVAEKWLGRAFLRQLDGGKIGFREGGEPELVAEEQTLRLRLAALQRSLDTEREKPPGLRDTKLPLQLEREIDQARQRYETVLLRLKMTNAEHGSLVGGESLAVSDVKKLLEPETVLVKYFIAGREMLAWVIDRESHRFVRLGADGSTLGQRIALLRRQIAAGESEADTSASLYRDLITPLEPFLRRPNLWLVPHGEMASLPFAALFDPASGKYLLEKHSLTLLPSASILPLLTKKLNPDEGRLLALGDPDGSLPHAASEAKAVAALFQSRPLLGAQATESALREGAGGTDYIHVAAHGTFDPARPLFSRLRLAPGGQEDGLLEVHEAFGLDLSRANLVVLSGCDTGLEGQAQGGNPMGWSRAFFYAGAPAVVTTLWAVDDEASRVLMERFYRALRQEKRSLAEALRTAQLEVQKQERWRSPRFWAGFMLTGFGS